MIELKIKNATAEQWPIVADMARANIGSIEKCGVSGYVGLCRDGLYVTLYLTKSGKTAVAYAYKAST
tara:strand:- start:27876 stop:28076 length:201 start_codon:yes stop_codon:yes gene_type:complete